MNGLEVFAATELLRRNLAGAKVEKVFQTGDDIFAFELFSGVIGKKFLMVMKDFIYLADGKPQAPDEPPNFCMLLRKHLDKAAITGVSQVGFDRIVSIGFSNGQTLVCEIFDGNVILLDGTGTIVAALRKKRWRTRSIFPGEKYAPPPAPADPRTLVEKYAPKNREIVKVLAADFGLGGHLSEEVCFRAGVEKLNISPDAGELARLSNAIQSVFDEALTAREGFSYSSGTVSSPVRMHLGGGKTHPTFFGALEAVSKNRRECEARTAVESEASKITAKQKELVDRQKALIEMYEENAGNLRRAGDELMANLPAVDSIIAKVRELGWDRAARVPGVKSADGKKSGKITLEGFEKLSSSHSK